MAIRIYFCRWELTIHEVELINFCYLAIELIKLADRADWFLFLLKASIESCSANLVSKANDIFYPIIYNFTFKISNSWQSKILSRVNSRFVIGMFTYVHCCRNRETRAVDDSVFGNHLLSRINLNAINFDNYRRLSKSL